MLLGQEAIIGTLDIAVFIVFVTVVVAMGLIKSGGSKSPEGESENKTENYFLAGRGLTWWLVGFSLIAANISTEQFVGMSGKSADWVGMAIASYEWIAAITLVGVAFIFLPKFLKAGIYTIPEFLERRYGGFSRTIMAVATMIILVGVPTASVIFSGAKVVSVFFAGTPILGDLTIACYLIAALAAVYVFIGGLKACAWTDLVWGASLILGGAVVMYLAFGELEARPAAELYETRVETSSVTVEQLEQASGWERFKLLNEGEAKDGPNGSGGKLHMVRPKADKEIPWTALIIGIWIPNFFYWGLNQYIMQRTLGSKSLAEGQKGIVFAAFLKLLIPFVVVIPGILAYNLFRADLRTWAIDRNAETIAMSAPGLYETLSDVMKPDPTDAQRQQSVDRITRALEKAKAADADNEPSFFSFPADFVALFPEDAALILRHNLSSLTAAGGQAPVFDDTSVPTIHEQNEQVIAALESFKQESQSKIADPASLSTRDYDAAFPVLLVNLLGGKQLLPGLVLAAIFGAVVSSLASMLNSASTIATMDIYRKIRPGASHGEYVGAGRFFVVTFVVIAAMIAPGLGNPKYGGIFTFIQ